MNEIILYVSTFVFGFSLGMLFVIFSEFIVLMIKEREIKENDKQTNRTNKSN